MQFYLTNIFACLYPRNTEWCEKGTDLDSRILERTDNATNKHQQRLVDFNTGIVCWPGVRQNMAIFSRRVGGCFVALWVAKYQQLSISLTDTMLK